MKVMMIEMKHYKLDDILKDVINDVKKSDTWKIQLTIAIKFMSKDNDEEHVMHSRVTMQNL